MYNNLIGSKYGKFIICTQFTFTEYLQFAEKIEHVNCGFTQHSLAINQGDGQLEKETVVCNGINMDQLKTVRRTLIAPFVWSDQGLSIRSSLLRDNYAKNM
jgi:hypothetical protein